jgi:hypothetical protein
MSGRTLMSVPSRTRSPHWYGVAFRIALLTFIGTLLSFSVILLITILGTVIVSAIRGGHPDLRLTYRHIALPAALVMGAIICVVAVATEVRHYYQTKALAEIARMS